MCSTTSVVVTGVCDHSGAKLGTRGVGVDINRNALRMPMKMHTRLE